MSDDIFFHDADFVIEGALAEAALEALRYEFDELGEAPDLEEAFGVLGFVVGLDELGGVLRILEAEGWADYTAMEVVGPYVQRGSYVKTAGGGDPEEEPYFYVFTGRQCHQCSLAELERSPNYEADVVESLTPAEFRFDLASFDEIDAEELEEE